MTDVNSQTAGQVSESDESSNRLFYNVIPKEYLSGPLVNATEQTTAFPQVHTTSAWISFLKKNRLLVVSGGAVILVAVLTVGLYVYFSRPEPSPALVEQQKKSQTSTENRQSDNTSNEFQETVPSEPAPPAYTTPQDWQKKFFGNETCTQLNICGDESDPDHDGLSNKEEFNLGTDPNNPDSDKDGLGDGDEVHIFGLNPLRFRTVADDQYSDPDYARGGYDPATGQKFSADKLSEIKSKLRQFGLHQPTLATLGDATFNIYGFGEQPLSKVNSTENAPEIDNSPEAKLSRDESRLNTIKKIGSALLKYKTNIGSFPETTSFPEMFAKVKPYILVATNSNDPLNKNQYVYTYRSDNRGQDFTLTFFSENQNQIIKYNASSAQKNSQMESADINDNQRISDLKLLQSALLVYSSANVAGSQKYAFPTEDKYKTELVPEYMTNIPKDPKTGKDYEYKVGPKFDTFTIKVALENPNPGTTGYLCNQEECQNY